MDFYRGLNALQHPKRHCQHFVIYEVDYQRDTEALRCTKCGMRFVDMAILNTHRELADVMLDDLDDYLLDD